MTADLEVGVLGAGAIGGTLGVKLSAAGIPTVLVTRSAPRITAEDLRVHDIEGRTLTPKAPMVLTDDPAALREVDVCLVTVKSRDTEAAGRTLAEVLRDDALVLSYQNGLRNPARLAASLPAERVFAGMITYNVVRPTPSEFRQATSGPLVTRRPEPGRTGARDAATLERLRAAFARSGDELQLREDITDVQAGKLLLNLNNSICAVTGVTILTSIKTRALRRAYAMLVEEGLRILCAAGMQPKLMVGISPTMLAKLLPLPDVVVLNVARRLVAIDPEARSSTLQDLLAGRPTEIDDLSGEIVYRAKQLGLRAPRNEWIVSRVDALSEAGPPHRFVSPDELLAALSSR